MKLPPPPALDWCLFLDVDGTLIELTDTPSEVLADAELKSLLRDAAERLGGAVALISGRMIETLDALFEPHRFPAAGLHGVERRRTDGSIQGAKFRDAHLESARATLMTLVQAHPGTLFEDKERSIAVHFRTAPHFADAMRDAVLEVAKTLGKNYHVQAGKMLYEIKPRGFTKATAIEAFMKEPPFRGRRPVFIGDDLTDEDGFRIVEALGGLSIAVGDHARGEYRLGDVAAVRGLLRQIALLHDPHRA